MQLFTICRRPTPELAAWGWCVTPQSYRPSRIDGRPLLYDCDAWTAYTHKAQWKEGPWRKVLAKLPARRTVILPDVVMDARATLEQAERFYAELRGESLLLVAQPGIAADQLHTWVDRGVGLAIGGDPDFKRDASTWLGRLARSAGVPCHMLRVNSRRRMRWALAAGCTSIDGGSPVLFPSTRAWMEAAAQERVQMKLL